MNAQHRYDPSTPHEKTFPALPPPTGRGFARTWWGHAWLRALEDSALDGQQVKQGRRYARSGAVGAVSVRPGGLTAVVRDPDGTAHRTDVLVQEFTEAEWDRLLGLAAAESGHIAALLDREVPPELAQDAAAAGVELLPGIGDLDPRCDCDEWDHCPHTAALCYQVARLLDEDPFVLLLLRGRAEADLVAELEGRSTAKAEAEAEAGPGAPGNPADEGVPAAEAYAEAGALPPLPPPARLPDAPGQAPTLDTEAQSQPPGLDVDAVEFLAQAAVTRAYRLLAEALAPAHAERAPQPGPTAAEDAVRLTAEADDLRVRSRLAAATDRNRAEMDRAVLAWGFGGAQAVAVLEQDWTPDRASLARARAALASAWSEAADSGEDADSGPDPDSGPTPTPDPTPDADADSGTDPESTDGAPAPVLRRVRARWTEPGGDRQLRLGREGRWWPYRRSTAGHWLPAGPGSPDPASALAALDPEE
ncbi:MULTISPECIES: SWF or SNF family helicase [unclassified Streptomyces]|uniref:SWIM zinc finger family protein n=1 Tax=unclassified Streptomyces TaxID=2593676 RepID=UPI000DC7C394|nr:MULTISPECIES: SWF or SNF family helicase [unclassified Streptomyces]AWZ07682.1 SWF or SNF family helicase [Streptomyces sp. ICC4]AWZ16158.1 SWF or SNF family helicase [Streptomyces sp. ICC1]